MNEYYNSVRDLVADRLGVSKDIITLESRLTEDLGADSLDLTELVMNIEDKYKISIKDEDSMKIKSVKDIVNYLEVNKQ